MRWQAIFAALAPCAAVAVLAAQTAAPAEPAIWIDVPFVAQARNACGPASVAMVMQYWHRKLRTGAAASDRAKPPALVSAPAGHPMRATEMEDAFREAGYRAFAFRGTWDDLQHHLRLGRPLIVALGASGPLGPLHFAVVAGMDPGRAYIFLNDPARRKMLRLSREGFASEWRRSGNWTLLAVPRVSD